MYGIVGAYVSPFCTLSFPLSVSLVLPPRPVVTYGWTFLSLHLFLPPRLYFYVFSAVLGAARTLPRARPHQSDLFLSDDGAPFRFWQNKASPCPFVARNSDIGMGVYPPRQLEPAVAHGRSKRSPLRPLPIVRPCITPFACLPTIYQSALRAVTAVAELPRSLSQSGCLSRALSPVTTPAIHVLPGAACSPR